MPNRSHHIDYRGNTHDRRMRRQWVFKTFGNGKTVCCFWCGKRMRTRFTIDRYPRCGHAGGRYTKDNIVPACLPCNNNRCQNGKCQKPCPNRPDCPNHQVSPF